MTRKEKLEELGMAIIRITLTLADVREQITIVTRDRSNPVVNQLDECCQILVKAEALLATEEQAL